jgi:hypothetical protein
MQKLSLLQKIKYAGVKMKISKVAMSTVLGAALLSAVKSKTGSSNNFSNEMDVVLELAVAMENGTSISAESHLNNQFLDKIKSLFRTLSKSTTDHDLVSNTDAFYFLEKYGITQEDDIKLLLEPKITQTSWAEDDDTWNERTGEYDYIIYSLTIEFKFVVYKVKNTKQCKTANNSRDWVSNFCEDFEKMIIKECSYLYPMILYRDHCYADFSYSTVFGKPHFMNDEFTLYAIKEDTVKNMNYQDASEISVIDLSDFRFYSVKAGALDLRKFSYAKELIINDADGPVILSAIPDHITKITFDTYSEELDDYLANLFPKGLQDLMINLRQPGPYKLPPSISKLDNLENLIISGCNRLELPSNFNNLKRLKYIRFGAWTGDATITGLSKKQVILWMRKGFPSSVAADILKSIKSETKLNKIRKF